MASSFIYVVFWGIVFSAFPLCRASELVSCRLGQTCVLPCRFHGDIDQVHWTREPEGLRALTFVDNRTLDDQHSLYKDRTALSEDLWRGNCSLLLSQVSLQDQGRFKCFTSSSRGDQTSVLQLSVFAPVQQVSLKQQDQRLLCSSEDIYPRPSVVWTPNTEANTTVTESDQGLFSVLSSVSPSDSDNVYGCNISSEDSRRAAVLLVKELPFYVDREVSSVLDGSYICVHNIDEVSVHLQFKFICLNIPISVWIVIVVGLIYICYDLFSQCKKKKPICDFEQLKENDELLHHMLSNYELVLKEEKTAAAKSEPQFLQKSLREEQERNKGEDGAPEDLHKNQNRPAVSYSCSSGEVVIETHNSVEIQSKDQQSSEMEKLVSKRQDQECTGVCRILKQILASRRKSAARRSWSQQLMNVMRRLTMQGSKAEDDAVVLRSIRIDFQGQDSVRCTFKID